jgi:hypothetical protein
MANLYAEEIGTMRERITSYFKTNVWWILVFLLFVIADTLLTMYILVNYFGGEANPFAGSKMFDWSFHFWRIDTVLIMIPLISLMPLSFKFVRNWLLQGVTIGYAWSVVNGLTIAMWQVDIGVYQFIPQWAYFFGVLFQFAVGVLILWIIRRLRGRRPIVVH